MRARIGAVGACYRLRFAALFFLSSGLMLIAAFGASAGQASSSHGSANKSEHAAEFETTSGAGSAGAGIPWFVHDPASRTTIDHSAWDRFLTKYVRKDLRGVNLVGYGFVVDADRKELAAYIGRLTIAPVISYTRPEQLAYWLNLYNALTVKVVLDHFPVDSIRDIDTSPGWFTDGPWKEKLIKIDGVKLSLDDIEHAVIRPIWRDPRIHYALNCASVGCPNLRMKAYTGTNVDELLDAAAHEYVNSWRAVEFENGEPYLSSIYRWYRADFGGSEAAVLAHLRKYAWSSLKRRLESVTEIEGYRYDWSLNSDTDPHLSGGGVSLELSPRLTLGGR